MSSAAPMQHAQSGAQEKNTSHATQPTRQSSDEFKGEMQNEIADQRPQTAVQRRMQEIATNSAQCRQLQVFQHMTQNDARAMQLKSMSAMMNATALQRVEQEEPLQAQFGGEMAQQVASPEAPKPNNTGLPDNLKSGIESLSGMSMDHVNVHYNSDKPAQLSAHAYAQGSEIHVAPGQERHLPHEAWHVVQQAQNRVRATGQIQQKTALEDGGENTSDIAQLKGPRNYAGTFKPEKDEMMKWLKDSGLIGMDLTPEGAISDEENAKIGWHHQYPYSHLWENHNHHALADHGANLKLGPMKNRLGDPGHEIDISYNKAKTKEGAESASDIDPTYSPMSEKLLKELYARPKVGAKENGPKADIDIGRIDSRDLTNEVYDESVDKETYWSEWYLSAAIRAKLLSTVKLGAAIDGTGVREVIAAKSTIISTLNNKLDGLRYTYATHTPALEGGTLGPFQKTPIIETGIPSSKLNRTGVLGEKLVEGKEKTYADLLHGILLGEKWIARGSQGAAHSLVEQFKDKMKTGNLTLIETCLKADVLARLKLTVETQYQQNVFDSLPKLDSIANEKAAFFAALKQVQLVQGAVILNKESLERVVEENIKAFTQTKTKQVDVEPDDPAVSFTPTYPSKGEEKTLLKKTFESFIDNDDYEDGLQQVARNLMAANALQRSEAADDDKHWVYDWEGNIVLSKEGLSAGIQDLIKDLIPTKTIGKGRSAKEVPNIDKVHEFSQEIIKWLTEQSQENEENWQEPGSEDEEEKIDWDKAKVAQYFSSHHKSKGKNLVLHLIAIASKPSHIKYAAGIERALRIPGTGYSDPTLTYPAPEEIANAEEGASWNFDSTKEGEFRQGWYGAEFSGYLAGFIAKDDVQEGLSSIVPT